MRPARADLESLLRARRLDRTLAAASPPPDPDGTRLAPTGWAALDEPLGGGLVRGHLSELIGPRSSGRSAVFTGLAAAAAGRGEAVALIDTHDRFDPVSAAEAGLDLGQLLWIRERGDAERAVKAMMLVLQAGGFGVVALDVADVPGPTLRRFPHTTWIRLARAIEGSSTAALLLASDHLARSPAGVTIALEPGPAGAPAGNWRGAGASARRLRGLAIRPRIISARLRQVPPSTLPGTAEAGGPQTCPDAAGGVSESPWNTPVSRSGPRPPADRLVVGRW